MESPHINLTVPSGRIRYPCPRRLDTKDDFFGIKVLDPYQWMEDDSSKQLQDFLQAEKKITEEYFRGHPNRDAMWLPLQKLHSYACSSCPRKAGPQKYVLMKKLETKNQRVLHVQDGLTGTPEVLVDPNVISTDGNISIAQWEVSHNGETLVYLESDSGSDWRTAKFKSITTGTTLPDTLTNIKFTMLAWTGDDLGVVYSAYPGATSTTGSNRDRNEFQELFYHHLGTDQTEDVLLVSFPDNPDYSCPAELSSCGKYLIVQPQVSCADNLVYMLELKTWMEEGRKPKPSLTPIIEKWEAEYKYVTSNCPAHLFRTNKDAPNFKLISIDLNHPQSTDWKEILPEVKNSVLEWCSAVQDYLFASYLVDVRSTLEIFKLPDGIPIQTIPLDIGNIRSWSGQRDDMDFFFQFVSFETPGTIYQIHLPDGSKDEGPQGESVEVKAEPRKPSCLPCLKCGQPKKSSGPLTVSIFHEATFLNYWPMKLVTKQVWFKSRDAVRVPMFLVHCARIKARLRPCLITGYGAHGYILKPYFEPLHTAFMTHMDGILAVVNVRGGGEFGEQWHEAGRLHKKQNTFDDFLAAAEYLIKKKYTSKDKLVISGTSSGGMSCAACVNQRPDLFAGAILNVGAMDMMRFHKFTIGYNWISDYGSPDKKSDLLYILKYSPYHNVAFPKTKGVQYPAVLVMTGEEDDRVVPCHSYKYVAELQETIGRDKRQTNPLLLRVEPKSGHGSMKPTWKSIEEDMDRLSFMSYATRQKFN